MNFIHSEVLLSLSFGHVEGPEFTAGIETNYGLGRGAKH